MSMYTEQAIDLLEDMLKYAKKRCKTVNTENEAREVIKELSERLFELGADFQSITYSLERIVNSKLCQ